MSEYMDAVLGDEWKQFLAGRTDVSSLSPVRAYDYVPLVSRAIHLRSHSFSSLPFHVYRGEEEVAWPLNIPPAILFRALETDWLVFGAAYLVKLGRGQVQRLSPQAISPQYDGELRFMYTPRAGGESTTFMPDELVWVWVPNLVSDVLPGVSLARKALAAARVLYAEDLLLEVYYKSGGMPATILVSERGFGQDESKVKLFFQKLLHGVANAFRILTLSGKVSVLQLTPPLKDMAFQEVDEVALKRVAWAFDIPQTMLTDAANYATAREHRMSFWRDTVIPQARMWQDELNRQLFSEMGLRLEFAPNELEILQADEGQRAKAVLTLVQAGVPLDHAMTIVGYDEEEIPVLPEPGLPAGTAPGGAVQMRKELRAWHKISRKSRKRAMAFEPKALPDGVTRIARDLLKAGFHVKATREELEADLVQKLGDAWVTFGDDAEKAWRKGDEYVFDPDAFLAATMGVLAAGLWAASEARWLELAGDVGAFPLSDEDMAGAMEEVHEQARNVASLMADTTKRMVAKVNDLVRQGMDEASAAAHRAFIFGRSRAENAAVTEVTSSRSRAVRKYQEAFARRNVKAVRVWLTANDEIVCPICGKYHQQPESVWSGDYPDGPPAHPRCRCDLALKIVKVGGEEI